MLDTDIDLLKIVSSLILSILLSIKKEQKIKVNKSSYKISHQSFLNTVQ
jgi:hypothetical protein